jgi:tryptophan 2,3-dioxygenase
MADEGTRRFGYTDDPGVLTGNDLDYGEYLKLKELLSLQQLLSSPEHHDELLFIIIHQAYELWFKLILKDLEMAIERMENVEVLSARKSVYRTVVIMRVLVQQIHILETMRPADFLKFRSNLNPASGFQSLQFRELEFILGIKDRKYLRFFKNNEQATEQLLKRLDEPDLRSTYYKMLGQLDIALPEDAHLIPLNEKSEQAEQLIAALAPIYQNPEENLELYLLTEALLDLDHQLSLWRFHHVTVVERLIGNKIGTGGSSGVDYLMKTVNKKAFPFLWDVRSYLKME